MRWVSRQRELRQSRLRETVLTYRAAFDTKAGRQVLAWLVERCGFLKPIESEEQRVLHNWGITLMENMGIVQGVNYERLVDAILNMTIPDEAIDDMEGSNGRG